MKILHVSAATSWRGGEQQIAWLVQGLKELGHASMVYCAQDSEMEKYCKKNSLLFESFVFRSRISLSTARALKKTSKDFAPDIIHVHDSHAHTFALMAAVFFGLKIPQVLSRRVDFPVGSSFLSRWKYNHPSIRKIICVSGFIQEVVSKVVKEKDKVLTIHSGIDAERFAQKPTGKLNALLNINRDIPLIGNVAALAPHKDHRTFVDACAIILKTKPTARFVLIGGDGGAQQSVQSYIDELQLNQQIQLLGYRRDVPALIGDLDVFLFSSKEEGLGTSVLDALAAGVPVVSTAAGGIPEIIQHEKNGWLAPVQDAAALAKGVLKVLDHPATADQWIAEGKITIEKFSKKKTARATLTVYDEIISSR